jgi:hypothetical protein
MAADAACRAGRSPCDNFPAPFLAGVRETAAAHDDAPAFAAPAEALAVPAGLRTAGAGRGPDGRSSAGRLTTFEALPQAPAAPAWVKRSAAASDRTERRSVPAEALVRALLKADPDAEAA